MNAKTQAARDPDAPQVNDDTYTARHARHSDALRKALARDRRRTRQRVVRYFSEKYPESWREVMAARS